MTKARSLTLALGGRWHGSYGQAPCPAHDDRRPSLSISDGSNGRLLAYCHAGCDFAEIFAAINCKGFAQYPQPTDRPATPLRSTDNADQARRCWDHAAPIEGTPAENYLRARGITSPLPKTLRFHSKAWHGPSAQALPAMVGYVQGAPNFAVHRTYLNLNGRGKALVTPSKTMLGSTLGGAVRLSQGGQVLAVAEGIETGLSLLCGPLQGEVSVWAALSASGMQSLTLPDKPAHLIVANDGDLAGYKAAQRLAERAHAFGWTVTLFPAPEGRDWNDVIQQMKGAAQ